MGDEQQAPLIETTSGPPASHLPAAIDALSRSPQTPSSLRTLAVSLVASFLLAVLLSLIFCSSSDFSLVSLTNAWQPISLESILGHDHRSSSLIVKLDATTGEWLSYEGITIIMRLQNRSDLPLYQNLHTQVAAFPPAASLTAASFHVTLVSVLPRAKFPTLDNYNDLIRLYHPRFERLKAAYSRLPHRTLTFTAAELQRGSSGLSFTVHPKSDEDREVLRGYEELTREVLGSADAGNEGYHLSVAYWKLKRLQEASEAEWDQFMQGVEGLLRGKDLLVGPPELCKSVTMLQFDNL